MIKNTSLYNITIPSVIQRLKNISSRADLDSMNQVSMDHERINQAKSGYNIRYSKADEIFRLDRCWWGMLETECVGDKFEMLVTDFIHWENHQHNEKKSITQRLCHQHLKSVTIIKSPTSLSPSKIICRVWRQRKIFSPHAIIRTWNFLTFVSLYKITI